MQHRHKKRFGQNFLEDSSIIQQIIQAISPQPTDNLIEIGPGLGALTHPLLDALNQLKVIEIDKDLHPHLNALAKTCALQCIAADVLTVDFEQFGAEQRLVGNLPYNISTPLLFHLLEHVSLIKDMHFMLQKEVVSRLCATPNTKAYGRLSVMTQAQCTTQALFLVPPSAFNPPPKVDSAIIRLTPHYTPLSKTLLASLERVTKQAFSMRRKTLKNTLAPLCDEKTLIALDIDPKQRPETLSVEIYLKLAKYFI